MDLETPTPPTPPAEPAAPVTPPETPTPPADPDEAQAIEVQGEKRVPLAALKAAREEAKAAKAQVAELDQLKQYVQQVKPYVDVLVANPSLMQPQRQPQQPASTDADPELVELARSLDYYKADGSPDLERAKKHDDILTRRATKIAQQMVQPVAQSAAKQQSDGNWHSVVRQKLPNGQDVNPQILAKYWQSLPIDQTADRRVAQVAWSLAAIEQLQASPLPQNPPPPANPPLHTENSGGGPRRGQPMTDVEKLITAARGIDQGKYTELTKGFTAGRTSSLED